MASIFTQVSKELGFAPVDVVLPTRRRAEKLAEAAKAGDREAFKTLFSVVRFYGEPPTRAEAEILDYIVCQWGFLRPLFSKPIESDEPDDPEETRKWDTV
ncbi:MAG TPA: hypothetical protein VG125_11210 [Pirellulales bacterium]|nr:hypothetical protein [Pirellulales bacterium]